ncbi:MAG: FtsW/RodA/SpoVE family cell cycle protein [Dehalococcoidia bacterium]
MAVIFHRPTELLLILLSTAMLALGAYSLDLSERELPPNWEWVIVTFLILFLIIHYYLNIFQGECEELIVPLVSMLVAFGLALNMRVEPELTWDQVTWLLTGGAVFMVTMVFLNDYTILMRYKYIAAATAIFLLGVTAFTPLGQTINGARLWLRFGPIQFQVTELLKVLLIVFLAGYLAERGQVLERASFRWRSVRLPSAPYVIPLALIGGMVFLMLLLAKDLGAVLILTSLAVALLYVRTGRTGFIAGAVVLLALNLVLVYYLPIGQFDYARLRIDSWLHPLRDVGGEGYQIKQALLAFSNGGMTGTGLGQGYPDYIPIVETDFIFAAIGEEMGLLGAASVVIIFIVLAFRGLKLSAEQSSSFLQLLGVGATTILAVQAAVIMAGNLAMFPVTGVTLPFVSYGGSSLVVNFVLVAMLVRLSADTSLSPKSRAAT